MSYTKRTHGKKARLLAIGLSAIMIASVSFGLIPSKAFAAESNNATVKFIWKGHDDAIKGASVAARLVSKNIDTEGFLVAAEQTFLGSSAVVGGETRAFTPVPVTDAQGRTLEYSVRCDVLGNFETSVTNTGFDYTVVSEEKLATLELVLSKGAADPSATTVVVPEAAGSVTDGIAGGDFIIKSKTDASLSYLCTTDATGVVQYADLPYGDYSIIQTSVPNGYTSELKTIDVTLSKPQTSQMARVDFKNAGTAVTPDPIPTPTDPTTKTFVLSLVSDQLTNDAFKDGVTLTLYDEADPTVDIEKALLNNANSWKYTCKTLPTNDADGKAISYKVKVSAVQGFSVEVFDASRISTLGDRFVVWAAENKGTIKIGVTEGSIEPVVARCELYDTSKMSVSTIDSTQTVSATIVQSILAGNNTVGETVSSDVAKPKTVAGSMFSIKDSSGAIVAEKLETGPDGSVSVRDLPFGDYTVIQTSAPLGFSKSTKDSVVAKVDVAQDFSLVTVSYSNPVNTDASNVTRDANATSASNSTSGSGTNSTSTTSPQTNDPGVLAYILLGVFGLAGLVYTQKLKKETF